MRKFLQRFVIATMIVGMMVGVSLAGTATVNHGAAGTPFTIAYETLGAARNVMITGSGPGVAAGQLPVAYTLGQALTSGNLVQISFTGLAYEGTQLNLCAANGAANGILIATATPVAGSNSQNFQVTIDPAANVAAGNVIWLTSGGAATCLGLTAGAFNAPLQVSATTTAGNKTATLGVVTAGGIVVDTASSANAVTVANEYAGSLTAGDTITIDYLGVPGNGTQFVAVANVATNVLAGSANKFNITRTARNYNSNSGAANAGLTVGTTVSLSDSQAWSGVTRVFLNNGVACALATNVAANSSPSGTVTLTPTAAAFNGSASANLTACVEVAGNTPLAQRTITIGYDISVTGAGNNDPAAAANATAQTWGVNGYQGVIPYLITNTARVSYCLINNSTANAATVIMDVLAADGGAITGLSSLNLGTIAARNSKLLTFNGTDVSLDGGNTVSVASLGTDKRYASRITVTGNAEAVFVECFSVDSYGKKTEPILTGQIAAKPWTN